MNPNKPDFSLPSFSRKMWVSDQARKVPHYPCRFDCPASHALAKKFIVAGKNAGNGRALENALEILHWPVEWSCLHGIAETRTPIAKISQRTDATALKCTLRLRGDSYPKEGAKALLSVLRFSGGVSKSVSAPVLF